MIHMTQFQILERRYEPKAFAPNPPAGRCSLLTRHSHTHEESRKGSRKEPEDQSGAERFITSLFPDLSGVETGPALSGNPPALSGNPAGLSGNPSALSGKPPIIPPDVPAALAERISTLGQRVSQPDLAQLTIDLCCHRPFSADELAAMLGKTRKHILERALTPLLRNDQLRHTIPDQPNHPNQAYTTPEP